MNTPLDRLKTLTRQIASYEVARKENRIALKRLFAHLQIDEKVSDFEKVFDFKAINLSGVSLKAEELGAVKEGKYLQILAISYDKEAAVKSKNISLGYFGRAELVKPEQRADIVEFVLRWRFEKSFRTLEHYYEMLKQLKRDI
jgi:hypothetical protein